MRQLRVAVVLLRLCAALSSRALSDPAAGAHPSEREMREIVRRLLGAEQDMDRCAIVERNKDKEVRIECRHTEWRTCYVTHVITSLHRKNGKWIIGETRRERRGDTGECGCCR